ncbi:MAG: IS110 family transposase [Chloroflexi bacterium]|nr:IS110 family transposase [Chloroflexota bacterium]
MQYHPTKLGIDISKRTFDVCLLNGSKPKFEKFRNDPEGFKKLESWLKKARSTELHIGMEATGNYWKALARFLNTSGHQVSVINPLKIKRYGGYRLHSNKTDKTDAMMIANFCLQEDENLLLWQDVDEETRHLRDLIQYRGSILTMLGQIKNRIESIVEDESVLLCQLEDKAHWEQRLELVNQEVEAAVKESEAMKKKNALLQTIPGIGSVMASYFLAFIPDVSAFKTSRQVVAYFGLDPSIQESGTSVKKQSRISKKGNATFRGKLYLPAIVAVRFNPVIKNLSERMTASGHLKKEIYVAAMRKLVIQMYGV